MSKFSLQSLPLTLEKNLQMRKSIGDYSKRRERWEHVKSRKERAQLYGQILIMKCKFKRSVDYPVTCIFYLICYVAVWNCSTVAKGQSNTTLSQGDSQEWKWLYGCCPKEKSHVQRAKEAKFRRQITKSVEAETYGKYRSDQENYNSSILLWKKGATW